VEWQFDKRAAPRTAAWAELGVGASATAGLAFLLAQTAPFQWPSVVVAVAAYGLFAAFVGARLARRHHLGWANRITLGRAVIASALAGALAYPALFIEQAVAVIGLTLLALAMDGIDGWLARRLDEASDFGAHFDMETDAVLILVLCAGLWLSGLAPAWVLLIGLMRPAFVVAGRLQPWLTRPLPPRFRRKAVCAFEIAALPGALLPFLDPGLRTGLLAMALLALCLSFLIDIVWLVRHRNDNVPIDRRTL
jgi:phosphatidylglycerophosphate synthase